MTFFSPMKFYGCYHGWSLRSVCLTVDAGYVSTDVIFPSIFIHDYAMYQSLTINPSNKARGYMWYKNCLSFRIIRVYPKFWWEAWCSSLIFCGCLSSSLVISWWSLSILSCLITFRYLLSFFMHTVVNNRLTENSKA